MGSYNTVILRQICQGCGFDVELVIQFKYGDVWQHDYRIGDEIKWDGNNIGSPEFKRVVVDGVAEPCANCGIRNGDYEILIEKNKITSVRHSSGHYDFAVHNKSYIILEE